MLSSSMRQIDQVHLEIECDKCLLEAMRAARFLGGEGLPPIEETASLLKARVDRLAELIKRNTTK